MGLSHTAAAEQRNRMTPATPAEPEAKPERGHRRGTYVDRSRTDGAELRGVGIQGKGIRGCMPHHAPGDPASYLERMAREDAQHDEIKARLKITRDRFKRPREVL